MSFMRCDVCGSELDGNCNETGIRGEEKHEAILCTLHHVVLRGVVQSGRSVNWPAISLATLRLNQECPTAEDDDEVWMRWSPVDRLAELYEELAPVTPDDWSIEPDGPRKAPSVPPRE
ncbi:MAG: hypothetical protein DIJKHBIC_00192 [Thermoanaerobaculia bacterium]|nr:hypothetical protein [Thermoanaerobaculia bacterium]